MSIEIIGTSGTVEYKNTVNQKRTSYTRKDISVSRVGNKFEMLSNDYSEQFDFSDVTAPVTANASALLDAINDLI